MVVFQRKVFGPERPPSIEGDHSKRPHSLKRSGSIYELQECSAHGRRPTVTQFTGAVNKEWLKGEGSALYEAFNMDETWALIRINPACLLAWRQESQCKKCNQFQVGEVSTRCYIQNVLPHARLDTAQ
jgi:hypothetical protein